MANFKYFNGETELKGVYYEGRKAFGTPVDFTPYWIESEKRWERGTVRAERVIEYKSSPSRHDCDARCYNATGKIMRCECACGGKNHGLGAFRCSEAA